MEQVITAGRPIQGNRNLPELRLRAVLLPAVIYPYSPVTGQSYLMTCTGQRVVTCSGGDNALVYLY